MINSIPTDAVIRLSVQCELAWEFELTNQNALTNRTLPFTTWHSHMMPEAILHCMISKLQAAVPNSITVLHNVGMGNSILTRGQVIYSYLCTSKETATQFCKCAYCTHTCPLEHVFSALSFSPHPRAVLSS